MTAEELTVLITEQGFPAYRAGQIYKWLMRGARSFDEMTDLPLNMRQNFNDCYSIVNCNIQKKLVSKHDDTVKYLYRLDDGETVESVLMQYKHGYSMCISTQAGCRMGCAFCASTVNGLSRNLSPSEMLSQIYTCVRDSGIKPSNVVLMGIGEPLDNFDNVLRFLQLVSDPQGLNIGQRHISVSTCGLVDKIYELIPMRPQFTLSVSLHAPNDEIRNRIMPVNRKWGVPELIKACRDYTNATSRRISFEYSLIKGLNDTDDCAYELASIIKGMLCHVNIIPVNPAREHITRPDAHRVSRFKDILVKQGINATVRRTLGGDIDASCGQLRRRYS